MARCGLIIALPAEVPASLAPDGPRRVPVCVSGMGRSNARAAARRLLAEAAPECLVSWGTCGALGPGLRVGDLVLPDAVGWRAERIVLAGPWLDHLRRRDLTVPAGCHTGLLQTCDRPVFSRRGLPPETVIVDMEAYGVAQVAQEAGLPMVAVKVVSDVVPQTLMPGGLWRWWRDLRAGFPTATRRLDELAEAWF